MANFKEIWVYTQGRNAWTEVYYSSADSLTSAASLSDTLINSFLSFRDELTILQNVRISDVANNRSALVVPINRPGYALTGTEGPDVVSTSAIVTLNSLVKGFRRNVWLRGLPDIYVRRDPLTGVDAPTENLQQSLRYYLSQLQRNLYQVRALSKITGTFPLAFLNVNQATINADGTLQLNCPGATFTNGQRIILTQFSPKTWPGLNGHWSCFEGGVNNFTLLYKSVLPAQVLSISKGRVRGEVYDFDIINQATSGFNRFGKRDTGGSFLGGRGRKRAVRLRSL